MRLKLALLLLIPVVILFLMLAYLPGTNWQEGRQVLPPSPQEETNEVIVVLGGDVMLGRSVMTKTLDEGDPFYPFRKVAGTLNQADVVFVNLENPIIKNCQRHTGGFTFCTTYEIAEGLRYAGIDVVSLANNHSQNYGTEGLIETKTFLDSIGIKYTDEGELAIAEAGGTKFGFLGFYFLLKTPNENDYQLIASSKELVDVLIVSPHWGVEYTATPLASQREWARRFVEAGADVVAGHHPHWVQEIEYIDGKPVYYSLGNFVFDQMWSEETKKGLIIKLTFENGKITKEERLPTYMSSWAQPEFVE